MASRSAPRHHLGLACALACASAPASAAAPVTTGVTDSGGEPLFTLVIVDPQDGAVIPGSPDALVPVTIEYTGIGESYVGLRVDDTSVGTCTDKPSPCTLEVTLAAGSHTLVATGQVFADEPPVESPTVSVEVVEGAATDTGATTGATSTSGPAPTSGTGDGGSSAGSGTTSGDDPADDKGCACATTPASPDLLGLALALLLVPPRRRRSL